MEREADLNTKKSVIFLKGLPGGDISTKKSAIYYFQRK
jgi:hypothetical protein